MRIYVDRWDSSISSKGLTALGVINSQKSLFYFISSIANM